MNCMHVHTNQSACAVNFADVDHRCLDKGQPPRVTVQVGTFRCPRDTKPYMRMHVEI